MRNDIKNIIYIRRILFVSLLFGMNCSFAMAHTFRVDTLLQNDINRVAYGIQPKWMTTSAVSSVKGDELKSFVPNIANMLNGRIPGLVVQQWGCEPGADSPAMNARGVNTYGSGAGLFIVIDGFQSTEAYFQQLTPQEIESITLLKDASATAIYGSKGANGVLLITTKRGTSDKIKINFSIQSGFQQPLRLPEFLGAYDYATLYNEALVNDGKSPLYTPMDLEAYKAGNDPIFHPDVDWYETILRKAAPITNYNFTASGSNEYFRYFVLLNVLDDRSLYRKAGNVSDFSKNGTYTRYNFRTNIDVKLSKRLQGAVTLGGTIEDKTNPGTSENTSGMFDLMSSIAPNAFPVYVSTGMYGGNSMYSNPLGDLMQTGYTSYNGRSLQAIFQLKGDLGFITPGLSVSGAVGFNTYFKSYSKKSRQYARYSVDRDNADEIIYTTYGQNTSLAGDESSSSQWRDYSLQASLNYNRTFNELHNIDAIYLGSYNDYVVTGTDLSYKNIAMGGRVTYSYDKRYIGEFSFGYNGTENFPKGHRFGFFPAGSLGWILSNEAFLKGNPILNYLKLRASYGIVGNDNIGGIRYMFDQYYDGYGYHLGNSNNVQDGLVQGKLANPDVTWEKEKKFNAGFEATLINKIDVSFDYFIQKRSNILSQPYRTVPDYLGISRPDINIGKVDNKGLETSIRYNGIGKKDLTYFVETSFWYAKNKVVYNAEAIQENEYLYGTGRMVGQPFVLEAIGFFKDEDDILKSPTQTFTDVRPGDIKYKDQNKDGKIDSNDYYPIGYTSMPQITLGLHGGITFKGFDLDVFFQGAANRTVYCGGKYYHAFQNDGKVSSIAMGRWTPETAETATYPRLSSENNLNNYQASSFWQKNGNFLKLRSLEIGYTLPFQFSRKINLEKVRIFANGTNLFSLDHMDGFTDPETMSGYPALRTISFGLSIQL
ncbi:MULTISPECIES: SusC/RagA family TonB-linked outer membrane protein [Bacteroides]|jgi:TonB-linked SusC/RagA family outer membrane protein|uniref:SusC/RagA family TonB-linked outer membrane protein n=2 Tax=Bacteroides TaxID=816 RepID=UPI000E47F5AA|nr:MULTISPECIES: TonB-dependent receptor [Bacteroides]QNL39443.1 TonB-dependent receptor [Bacteroides sp. M10]RGR01045.1 TonB-dependent receptor [Bacteroides sp. AF26-7BH]RGY30920.1 TonB-dependent receptor [Bacteroides sp. OF02-3LB]